MKAHAARIVAALGLLLLALPAPAGAQGPVAADSRARTPLAMDRVLPEGPVLGVQNPDRSTGMLVAGGLLGAGAGLLVGGGAGAMIGGNRCSDPGNPDSCRGLEGFFIGAYAAQAVAIPLGVHLMNGRQGRLGRALLFSSAVAAGGMLAVYAIDSGPLSVGIALSIPVAQVIGSVRIESRTARASPQPGTLP